MNPGTAAAILAAAGNQRSYRRQVLDQLIEVRQQFPLLETPPSVVPPSLQVPDPPKRKRALPDGAQWFAHDGRGAKMRRLRQLTAKLPVTELQRSRLAALVAAPKFQQKEHARLMILNIAREAAEGNGLPYEDALDSLLDRFERQEREEREHANAAEVPA